MDHFINPLEPVQAILIAVALLICVVTDIRSRKIYNWVTFPAMLAGFLVLIRLQGAEGALHSVEGFFIGLISLILMAVLQLLISTPMRLADVKLLCAVGMISGPQFALYALILTTIAGGILGIAFAAQRGVLSHTVRNLKAALQVSVATQSTEGLQHMEGASKAGYMPYAPAIASGALLAWILMGYNILR